MKLWELHTLHTNGPIRTTPGGEAESAGLILSEKAYLPVVSDFRPAQVGEFVHARGECGLVLSRSRLGDRRLVRADEVSTNAATGQRV